VNIIAERDITGRNGKIHHSQMYYICVRFGGKSKLNWDEHCNQCVVASLN